MKVVANILTSNVELLAELENVAPRDRAERLRTLATLGLYWKRMFDSGGLVPMAQVPQGPAPLPAAPASQQKRKKLRGIGLGSLAEG